VSDIGLHWTAFDLLSIALAACSPGLLAGLLLGAVAWRARRVSGAALGALAGLVLNAALLLFCFRSRIALGGASLLALTVSFPGMVPGGMAAAWHAGERWRPASVAGAAIGGVAWLGGWSYFN